MLLHRRCKISSSFSSERHCCEVVRWVQMFQRSQLLLFAEEKLETVIFSKMLVPVYHIVAFCYIPEYQILFLITGIIPYVDCVCAAMLQVFTWHVQ